jgi:uncharacterized protein YbjQ (UPF0145 family)
MDEARQDRDHAELKEVEIYTSPWVSGARTAVYFGTVAAEVFLVRDLVAKSAALNKAAQELFDSLRDEARRLGANAVVGLEVTLDPFARSETGESGVWLRAVGSAVSLSSLS